MDEQLQKAFFHLDKGDYSALEEMLGGSDGFDRHMVNWFGEGRFRDHPELLAEALSCACMLGRYVTAKHLLEAGVEPYAGMKTWLAGPHWAASGGHPEIMKLFIDRGISLEVENKYGGTVLGQALWSAVNEHKPAHAEVIEMLIDAGAIIEHGTLEWWNAQDIPNAETKTRVASALMQAGSR